MIYEIINPSDKYTIEAELLEVAVVACLLLGRGQYAFNPLEPGGKSIPIMMFGNADDWCMKEFGENLDAVVDRVANTLQVALVECFESCVIGEVSDRESYLKIEDPAERIKWHNERRSSLNDIGGRARKMAEWVRQGSSNPLVAAPQQVF